MKKAHQVKQGYGMHTSLINFFLHCMCHLLCKRDGILKKLKIKSIKEVADNNETLVLSTKHVIFPSTLYFWFQVSKQIKNDYSQKNALV